MLGVQMLHGAAMLDSFHTQYTCLSIAAATLTAALTGHVQLRALHQLHHAGAEELRCTPLAELLPAGADASSASLLHGGECSTGQVVLQLSGGAAVLSVQGGAATLIKFAPGEEVEGGEEERGKTWPPS